EIFSGFRSRSTPPYVIDLSVYPGGRPDAAPTRYSPAGSTTRKVLSTCGLIVSDPDISCRVKEEGAGASPSIERRPVSCRGATACSNRKTEKSIDVIPLSSLGFAQNVRRTLSKCESYPSWQGLARRGIGDSKFLVLSTSRGNFFCLHQTI